MVENGGKIGLVHIFQTLSPWCMAEGIAKAWREETGGDLLHDMILLGHVDQNWSMSPISV